MYIKVEISFELISTLLKNLVYWKYWLTKSYFNRWVKKIQWM